MRSAETSSEGCYTDRENRRSLKKPLSYLLLLASLSALLFLHHLGDRSLSGSEGRWAEAAREMLASSDFITPRINGTPYRDKPFLSYLLIVAAAPLTGGEVTELSARLPSALSAIGALFLLYSMGSRLYDRETGLLASLILGTSFFTMFWGRTASADLMTMTGLLLTLWIFVRYEREPSKLWLYPFYLSMALNSLTKGLLGFALPMVILIPYALIRKRSAWVFNRQTLPAALLALLVYLAPFLLEVASSGATDSLYLVFKENIVRFFSPFDHKEPFYFYFYQIFLIFAPWAFFLPGALIHFLKEKKPWDDSRWFTLLYFCTLFAFFTLSGSRRNYYLLPLFPAAALMVGKMWSDLVRNPKRGWILWVQAFLPTGLLMLTLGSAALLLTIKPSFLTPYEGLALVKHAAAAAVIAGGLALAIAFCAKAKPHLFIAAALSAVGTVNLYYINILLPEAESFRHFPAFCRSVNALKIPQEQLGVFHQRRKGSLYFCLDKVPIQRFEKPDKALEFLEDSRNALIVEAKHLEQLGRSRPGQILLEEALPPFKKDRGERFLLIRGGGMKPNPFDLNGIAFKVDVDTYRGLQRGVPALLALFREFGLWATFFVSLGPDRSGRAIFRVFTKKGFLKKMIRTGAPRMYGLSTLLYGTLLPAPMIGRSFPEILRSIPEGGHEIGIHCWDHVKWQDRLHRMDEEEIRREFALARTSFRDILNQEAHCSAAPGWVTTARSLSVQEEAQLKYCSDVRGTTPFFPVLQGRRLSTLQIPTTLPTLDEIMGSEVEGDREIADYYLERLRADGLHVMTVHAETEGLSKIEAFRRILEGVKGGLPVLRLAEIADRCLERPGNIPACPVEYGPLPGRAGKVSKQGAEVD